MKRISAEKEISYISNVIEKNIEYYEKLKDKGFLSENILSQLRNLILNFMTFLKELLLIILQVKMEQKNLYHTISNIFVIQKNF